MKKRIVVAGSREYTNYEAAKEYIELCISRLKERYTLVFVSGGCRGADELGERYARENGYKIEIYAADWDKYGKAAGSMRNKKMAEAADYIICFWDGKSRGTRSMIECAEELGKPLRVKNV